MQMLTLYFVRQIRQIELSAYQQQEPGSLMRAAGWAAAQYALKLLAAPAQTILILAGPGNNGGDAFEVAVHLAHAGHRVHILHHPPKENRSDEGAAALKKAKDCDAIVWLTDDAALKNNYALAVDGLYGVGLRQQKFSASVQHHIAAINALHCPVLALDVPSGLNADTGNLISDIAICATHTVTFIGDKVGLHTANGRDHAGVVTVANLGVTAQCFPASAMQLNQPMLFPKILRSRAHNTSKGSNGTVYLCGGTSGMQGAVVLAARSALYCGAGRVIAGFIGTPPEFDPMQPEIMCCAAQQYQANPELTVVIGPGLGNTGASFEVLSRALLSASPVVADADALNLIAQQPALMALCNGRDRDSTLLTPHPLEAARLLACSVTQIQSDRVDAARKIARRFSSIVILKGSGSVIAHPDGRTAINPTGNAGLASGGTGDVLAGACGALIAQHGDIWEAALAATYLHGAAADNLVQSGAGPVGLTASEIIHAMRDALNGTSAAIMQNR